MKVHGDELSGKRSLEIQAEPEQLSFILIVTVLLRHRRAVFGLPLLGAVLLIAVGLITHANYTSKASFMPQAPSAARSSLSGIAAQIGLAVPGTDPGQSPGFYVDLLTSRTVLDSIVKKSYSIPAKGGAVSTPMVDLLDAEGDTPEQRQVDGRRLLAELLSIDTDKETGVVLLSVRTHWASLSKEIADDMLALVSGFNLERRQAQAQGERTFMEGRLQEIRSELRESEDRLQKFLQQNRDYRNSPELTFEQDRLQREVSTKRDLEASLTQSYEQARIDEVRNTAVITIVDAPDLPAKQDSRLLLLKGALGLILGAALGILIAFVREAMQRSRHENPQGYGDMVQARDELVGTLRSGWSRVRRSRRQSS
jgi:uncharacterized protein involved in exopolysaccharide biosynthesis